jgi:hypothetical protein
MRILVQLGSLFLFALLWFATRRLDLAARVLRDGALVALTNHTTRTAGNGSRIPVASWKNRKAAYWYTATFLKSPALTIVTPTGSTYLRNAALI